jgi:hypothetical protein
MSRQTWLCTLVVIGLCLQSTAQDRVRVVVVVNPDNPIRDISLPNLRDFFQCEKLYWRNGQLVTLFSREIGSLEHEIMLRALYSMSQSEYERLWVMKQVRGEVSCRITELPSRGILQEGLRTYPGAIALVRETEVTPQMKIITVNGKHAADIDYPLQ